MQDVLFEDFKPSFLTKITQVDIHVIESFLVRFKIIFYFDFFLFFIFEWNLNDFWFVK